MLDFANVTFAEARAGEASYTSMLIFMPPFHSPLAVPHAITIYLCEQPESQPSATSHMTMMPPFEAT